MLLHIVTFVFHSCFSPLDFSQHHPKVVQTGFIVIFIVVLTVNGEVLLCQCCCDQPPSPRCCAKYQHKISTLKPCKACSHVFHHICTTDEIANNKNLKTSKERKPKKTRWVASASSEATRKATSANDVTVADVLFHSYSRATCHKMAKPGPRCTTRDTCTGSSV